MDRHTRGHNLFTTFSSMHTGEQQAHYSGTDIKKQNIKYQSSFMVNECQTCSVSGHAILDMIGPFPSSFLHIIIQICNGIYI